MTLEWNAGGWFGGQIGSTAWILVAAVLAGLRDSTTGLILLAIFLLPNFTGTIFWLQKRLSCYAAMQWLLVLVGISGVAAVYVLERALIWREIQSGGEVSASYAYALIVLVVLALMALFYFRFGRGPAGSARNRPGGK